MSLLLALLYAAPPEPVKRGSNGAQSRKPQRSKYEVDRFSDFERKPIAVRKDDDDELMLIFMMQGA